MNALYAARTAFIASEASRKIKLALQKQTRDTSIKSFHLAAQVYCKGNDGKAWHGHSVIAGICGKIVLVWHGRSLLRVSPVHLLPVCDADIKQRADDTVSDGGQDGLPQSGKVDESLSCDKGEQTDVLVTIDGVISGIQESMEYFWDTFGVLLGHFWSTPWSTFGTLLEYSMEYFWGTFGVLLEHFWSTFGALLEYFWGTFGVLLEHFWSTFWAILEYFWNTFGHFLSTLRLHGMIL